MYKMKKLRQFTGLITAIGGEKNNNNSKYSEASYK